MGNRSSTVLPKAKLTKSIYFYYLNRKEEVVYYISDEKIDKKSFKAQIGLNSDSAIGFINDASLALAGGTNKTGKITKDFMIVDMDQMFVRRLCKLPFGCKEGTLIQYMSSILYVGGICLRYEEASIPLLKYKIFENKWEGLTDLGFTKDFEQCFESSTKILSLKRPGNFLLADKLYYFGGTFNEIPNNLVFAISMNKTMPRLEIIKIRATINLISPLCASGPKYAIICGGFKGTETSTNCYKFKLKYGFKELSSKKLEINENYPPKVIGSCIVQSAFPSFAVKSKFSDWKIYKLSGSSCLVSSTFFSNSGLTSPPRSSVPQRRRSSQITPTSSGLDQTPHRSSILHITYSTVNIEKNRKTTPLSESVKIEELRTEDIINIGSDSLVKVNKKQLVKLILKLKQDLDASPANPLILHQISYALGQSSEVYVNEVYNYLIQALLKDEYSYSAIKGSIRNLQKFCKNSNTTTEKLNEVLEKLQIPDKIEQTSKETAVLIVTRMIKALVGYY